MTLEEYREFVKQLSANKNKPTFRQLQACFEEAQTAYKTYKDKIAFGISGYAKYWCSYICQTTKDNNVANEFWRLYWEILKWESPYLFDSYMLYLEKDRPIKERFYQPRRKQLTKLGVIQALQDIEDDKYDILTISLPPGTGKAQPLYSKVLTPNGFVEMGDIKVGDKVISGDGKISNVLGVFPQGKKPIYELTFDDGSKCRCSDEHLWTVQTRDDRRKGNKYRTVELKDMLHNFKVENGKRCNYSIDYVPKIELYGNSELEIKPYVLGALIANGNLDNGSIIFSTADTEVIDRVKAELPQKYELRKRTKYDYAIKTFTKGRAKSELRKSLEKYNLFKKKSYEKHIPSEYLYASYNDRLDLLRGLMDCDGYAEKTGTSCAYTTVSEQLAYDVQELVHSLGGYASITKGKSGYKHNGEYIPCKDHYDVNICFDANKPSPFYLSRKKDRYKPKRQVIKRFITDISYVGDEECQCIYIDNSCHLYITDNYIITHNTTIMKFFVSWKIGRNPEMYNLFYSHSDGITRMFYDGVLDITSNRDYRFYDIFPDLKLIKTDAKAQQLTFNSYKPFPNLQTGTIDSNLAGRVRCNGYLLCDDLIGKQEQALNKTYLDKLWEVKYTGDAKQRKMTGCKEIHIATRWSVHDIIGRIMALLENDKRARFITIDCYDENRESQFDYDYGVGLTTEFLNNQELFMDSITFNALYRGQTVEREGLLYTENDIRRYVTLPDGEPDAIMGICDTKNKGTDYFFLPCFYVYGNDHYLVDCVCNNSSDYGIQYGNATDLIINHNMQQVEFESNNGGDRVSFEVANRVKERGGRCNITNKPTESNKETKIIVNADWIKKHVLFKDTSLYEAKSDYATMMNFLLSYTVAGKNTHDDIPDGMAMYALFVTRKMNVRRKAYVMKSPI